MKQRHFYLTFLTVLVVAFLPFNNAQAAYEMGTVQLGTITLTRGETKTIDSERVAFCVNHAYKFDFTLGWASSSDAGFYAHSYQNDGRSKFSLTAYATCYQQKLSCSVYYTQSDGLYCVKHFYYLVTVNSDSYTKVERDVELAAAGTLSWRINSSDKNNITHLTLHGDLNGDDLKFLREMAGYNDNQGNLRYLDLRDVHFVTGGSSYVTIYGDQYSLIGSTYSIPDGAFYWCRKLTEIWLPEKGESIGVWAFYHCDFLTTVHIPEGTKYIYGQNFNVCYNLKELSIPSTVKYFYPNFQSSYKFRTLYCYAVTPPFTSSHSFENITNLYVPQGCKNEYLKKEGWGRIANIYETLPLPNVYVTSITLNKTSLSLQTGQSETLTATVKPDNATDKTVTWSSDKTSVATVDNNGKVTAKAKGSATITCTANDGSGVKATCGVTVTDPEIKVTSITLNKTSLSLQTGQEETLTATVKPDNATNKTVTWSSSPTGIVTIDNGKVTAVSAGSATITCKANDESGVQATCEVTVTSVPIPDPDTDISKLSNVIYINKVEASTGSQIDLSIKMKNTAPIRGFQFSIYLPKGVTVAKSNKGKILASLSDNRRDDDDEHTLTAAEQPDGSILFLCGSQYDDTFTGNDGEIATLTVNMAEDMADGDYPLVLKNIKLSETDISKYYETERVKTTLTVASFILGDINNDKKVDVSDYIGIANRILGKTPDNFNERAADVDGSKVIDVSDYIGVANIILTGSIYGKSNQSRITRKGYIE